MRFGFQFGQSNGGARALRAVPCALAQFAALAVLAAAPAAADPQMQFLAGPDVHYLLHVPHDLAPGAPLLVVVHGSSRNAADLLDTFEPWANKYGALLVAPYFADPDFDDYQRLGREGRGRRSDIALSQLVDFLQARFGTAGAVALFGYSGGAQFVERYAMAHPERVDAVVVASAGWHLFPYSDESYPYGIAAPTRKLAATFDPQAFLRVPMLVTVGADDRQRDSSLRTGYVDFQGPHRYRRAMRWSRRMGRAADDLGMERRVRLRLIFGGVHSFSQNVRLGLDGIAADFLLGQYGNH